MTSQLSMRDRRWIYGHMHAQNSSLIQLGACSVEGVQLTLGAWVSGGSLRSAAWWSGPIESAVSTVATVYKPVGR